MVLRRRRPRSPTLRLEVIGTKRVGRAAPSRPTYQESFGYFRPLRTSFPGFSTTPSVSWSVTHELINFARLPFTRNAQEHRQTAASSRARGRPNGAKIARRACEWTLRHTRLDSFATRCSQFPQSLQRGSQPAGVGVPAQRRRHRPAAQEPLDPARLQSLAVHQHGRARGLDRVLDVGIGVCG